MTTPFKKASYCLAKASKFLRLECVVNGGLAKVLPQKNEMFASVAVFLKEREREKERTSKGKFEKRVCKWGSGQSFATKMKCWHLLL